MLYGSYCSGTAENIARYGRIMLRIAEKILSVPFLGVLNSKHHIDHRTVCCVIGIALVTVLVYVISLRKDTRAVGTSKFDRGKDILNHVRHAAERRFDSRG